MATQEPQPQNFSFRDELTTELERHGVEYHEDSLDRIAATPPGSCRLSSCSGGIVVPLKRNSSTPGYVLATLRVALSRSPAAATDLRLRNVQTPGQPFGLLEDAHRE